MFLVSAVIYDILSDPLGEKSFYLALSLHCDILFIYLSHQAIDKLFPDILDQLKPNAKILCYRFCIRNMTPDKVNADKTLFLYTLNKGTRVNQFR